MDEKVLVLDIASISGPKVVSKPAGKVGGEAW